MRVALYVALMAALLSPVMFGQALSGTVVGTVTDQAAAVIPGAKVTLTSEGTRFTRTVETNQSGQYVASSFPPGKLRLEVQVPGFQKLVREGVELTAADTLTVNLQLQVGSVEQTIEVTGAAPLLQTQTASVSSLVTNQQILETPLNGRSFTQLLQLMPGAAASSPALTAGGSGYRARANQSISINGSQTGNNSYLVDGMYNKELWLNGLVIVPPIDAIQEVRVMSSNFSAEYGDAAGAVTVAQSKSGTNQYHGSLYEFLRNDKLDANTFFNNRSSLTKSGYRRNEFGGTFGGPIQQNKMFFFGDYQGIRRRQPTSTVSTLPTLARQNMVATGDFSALGTTVYDPTTLVTGTGGTQVRAAFAGNQIPTTRLDPVAVKLIRMLPTLTSSAASRNYTFQDTTAQRTDQFDVRLDRNLRAADRLFFKFSYDNTATDSPGSLPAPSNSGVSMGKYLTGGSRTLMKNWAAGVNFTKVIGTSIVNETRLGAVRWNFGLLTEGMPYKTAAELGMPGINISDNSGGLPGFTISGFQTIGDSSTYPEFSRTVSYQYENITSIVRSSHNIKFGARYLRHVFNGYSAFPTRGTYSFNGQFTRQVGGSTSTTALSDFALGASDTITRGYFPGVFGIRLGMFAAFVEDTWRVNNRLTVNLGLRYELQGSPYEVHDRWANFNIVTGKLMIANVNGNSRSVRNNDSNNFGPRVGITYQLDPKTVIRTGAGVSYTEQFDGGTQLYKNLPYMVTQKYTTDTNGAPVRYIEDGLPLPEIMSASNAAVNGGSPMAYPVNFRTPKMFQWSFGIQREIFRDLMLETSYVGSKGFNLMAKINTNQPYPGAGDRGPRRPLYSVNQLVGDLIYHDNWGASKYHSLQVRLQTRARAGLTTGLSYTWSKNMINTGENQGANSAQDARNLQAEWGNASVNRRHMLVINHVYEMPFGQGRAHLSSGWLGRIVGNWNISGVWGMMTGTWFTARNSTEVSNAKDSCNGCPAERPDRISDGNLPAGERTIDKWFDTSAFQVQKTYTFGNAGNNILEGPGYFNVDAGIHRNFSINERWKAVFRLEMFNAFNHANFSNPASTINSSTTGQISGTQPARSMQMGLKLTF